MVQSYSGELFVKMKFRESILFECITVLDWGCKCHISSPQSTLPVPISFIYYDSIHQGSISLIVFLMSILPIMHKNCTSISPTFLLPNFAIRSEPKNFCWHTKAVFKHLKNCVKMVAKLTSECSPQMLTKMSKMSFDLQIVRP